MPLPLLILAIGGGVVLLGFVFFCVTMMERDIVHPAVHLSIMLVLGAAWLLGASLVCHCVTKALVPLLGGE